MLEIKTDISINTSLAKIWNTFVDFKNYPEWNPLITSIQGDVSAGKYIKAKIMGIWFRPKVLKFENEKEVCWTGHIIFPFIFTYEHWFKFEPRLDGSVKFSQGENYNGILLVLFNSRLKKRIKEGFESMNSKLKERCEL